MIKKYAPKVAREVFEHQTQADKIVFSKGTFKLRYGYFYRHGRSEDTYADSIQRFYGKAVKVIAKSDCWNNWPKESYFEVEVQVVDEQHFIDLHNKIV